MARSLRMLASALKKLLPALSAFSFAQFAKEASKAFQHTIEAFSAITRQTWKFQSTIIRAAARICTETLRTRAASLLVAFWSLIGAASDFRFTRASVTTLFTSAAAFARSLLKLLQSQSAWLLAHFWRGLEQTRGFAHASFVLFAVLALASAFALGGDSANAGAAPIKRVTPRSDTLDPRELSSGAFIDQFNRLDERRWHISDRGSNGSWTSNDFPRRNVALSPEGLVMTLSRNPPGSALPYSGAEISTRAQYEYGYFEVRMRTPRGGGLVTGFFTFARPGGSESWHEVDVEITGRNPRQVEVTRWFKGRSNGGARKPLWFDSSEEFHTYAFEWTPGAVRWYVDNHLIEETGTEHQPVPHGPQNLFINLWISRKMRSWVGEINPDEAPWRLTISCAAQAARYTGQSLCPDR